MLLLRVCGVVLVLGAGAGAGAGAWRVRRMAFTLYSVFQSSAARVRKYILTWRKK